MKSHRSLFGVLSICLIIIISLGFYFLSGSLHRDLSLSSFDYYLSLQVDHSDTQFVISGHSAITPISTRTFDSELSQQTTQQGLRSSQLKAIYNVSTHSLDSLRVVSMSGSSFLPRHHQIFIERLIVPRIGENILPTPLIILSSVSQQLLGVRYHLSVPRVDSYGLRQDIGTDLIVSCGLGYFLKLSNSCSLKGNYRVSTSVNEGDLTGSMVGTIILH